MSVVRSLSAEQLIRELDARGEEGDIVAFDGDGTLWSGDVGEDLLEHFVGRKMLLEAALPALRSLALEFGVGAEGDANAIAARLFESYRKGRFPEREICEMMAWCFAGWTAPKLRKEIRARFSSARFVERIQPEMQPIVDWARRRKLKRGVISASPEVVVVEAAAHLGFQPNEVAAARAALDGDFLLPRLAEPIPYAETKPRACKRLLGEERWLASFGDNVFDLDLLKAAEVPVLVRPKPALEARLSELEHAVRLKPE